jgi:single-stranded-DNA-specific exonuclease
VDLGAAIARLAREGLIGRGGGHRMAVGLNLSRSQLEPAMARLGELLARTGAGAQPAGRLAIDGIVAPRAATPELCDAIAAAGPFGAGAPAPRVAVARATLLQARPVGQGHLALALGDPAGGRLDAIAFRALEGPLGASLLKLVRAPINAAGRLEAEHWGGRVRVKLHLEDAAPAG